MKNAAVGFRVHSGWAAMVAVALKKGEPVVLCRERPHLVKIFNYSYRQPYHTAKSIPLEEGRAFISKMKEEARGLARTALREMQGRLREAGYDLSRCAVLLASGRELPKLEEILAAHPLMHTADGELFREALVHAGGKCGLEVLWVRELELLSSAAKAFGRREEALLRRVTEAGRGMGPPWSQDEKFATLAAWLALASGSMDGSKPSKNRRAEKD